MVHLNNARPLLFVGALVVTSSLFGVMILRYTFAPGSTSLLLVAFTTIETVVPFAYDVLSVDTEDKMLSAGVAVGAGVGVDVGAGVGVTSVAGA